MLLLFVVRTYQGLNPSLLCLMMPDTTDTQIQDYIVQVQGVVSPSGTSVLHFQNTPMLHT